MEMSAPQIIMILEDRQNGPFYHIYVHFHSV
jgi:hypothetical protein